MLSTSGLFDANRLGQRTFHLLALPIFPPRQHWRARAHFKAPIDVLELSEHMELKRGDACRVSSWCTIARNVSEQGFETSSKCGDSCSNRPNSTPLVHQSVHQYTTNTREQGGTRRLSIWPK